MSRRDGHSHHQPLRHDSATLLTIAQPIKDLWPRTLECTTGFVSLIIFAEHENLSCVAWTMNVTLEIVFAQE